MDFSQKKKKKRRKEEKEEESNYLPQLQIIQAVNGVSEPRGMEAETLKLSA